MRKLVSIRIIEERKDILGADKIEALRVGGWWCVSQKDQFKVGDRILYYEVDSFLPIKPEYEFLLKGSSIKKQLVGGQEVEGIRLKTIKLRGQISQGMIMPVPEGIAGEIGDDVSEQLGVTKWDPPLPAELSGIAKGPFPLFIPKTDEERIQNMTGILSGFYSSEKIDGSSITFFKRDGIFGVCSRNLELEEGDSTQWRIAKELGLPEKLSDNIAIQGELVGEGIQGNPLKIKGQEVYFFNAYNISSREYLDYQDFKSFVESLGIKNVPIIDKNFMLPKTVDDMLKYAEGKSLINPNVEREGVVIRSKTEMKYNGQRLSFKAISNKYLLNE